MEGDYISREAAVKAANEWVSEACMAPVMRVSRLFDKLAKVPAADVAEVVQGKWENGNPICPVCGENKFKDLDADIWCDWKPDFCPNCGAKMEAGGNE